MEMVQTKCALRRRPGYAVGEPAPVYLVCPCGGEVDVDPAEGGAVKCEACGRTFDRAGWILTGPARRDELPPAPTYQGDLFRPMCGRSVAAQREMFPDDATDTPVSVDGPRHRDLPGQQTFV